jgi:lipooligosaccharide transport system permease protein
MMLLSGVFFPLDQLPPALQGAANLLPLTHAVAVARPLLLGQAPQAVAMHLGVLAATTVIAYLIAARLTRRRLLR